MKLILDTCNQLTEMNKKPKFVINFIGGSVKLISSNRDTYIIEEQKYLGQIAKVAKKMLEAGIHLEVCMAAVNILGVNPSSINPSFTKVANGWIAEKNIGDVSELTGIMEMAGTLNLKADQKYVASTNHILIKES